MRSPPFFSYYRGCACFIIKAKPKKIKALYLLFVDMTEALICLHFALFRYESYTSFSSSKSYSHSHAMSRFVDY